MVSFSLNSLSVDLIAWNETETDSETWGFISMASLLAGYPAVSVCRQSQRQTCRPRAHKISIE